MKKCLRFTAFLVAIVLLLSFSVSAADVELCADTHIANAYGQLSISSSYAVTVHFTIHGSGIMDELGASMIRVQRSTDGINWEVCETYWSSSYPQMIGSGYSYSSSITYQGEAGYQYRAFILFHAKNSSGTRTAMKYAY